MALNLISELQEDTLCLVLCPRYLVSLVSNNVILILASYGNLTVTVIKTVTSVPFHILKGFGVFLANLYAEYF